MPFKLHFLLQTMACNIQVRTHAPNNLYLGEKIPTTIVTNNTYTFVIAYINRQCFC